MILQKILKALAAIALSAARMGAGAASTYSRYQPELPMQLRN